MVRFAEHFALGLNQFQLDFVNIPIETDIDVFIDPYALSVASDAWAEDCNDLVVGYFELVLEMIRSGRDGDGRRLLSRLSEPNETHLGLSRGRPAGRSIGRLGADQIYDRLAESRAVQSGLLEDLADCELLIPGISRDKISDITTNIIKRELVLYTQRECQFYGIPTTRMPQTLWDPVRHRWVSEYVELPLVPGERGRDSAVILVPKAAVRLDLAYDTRTYLNKHVLEFLAAEHLEAGTALVQTLRDGRRKVTKRALKELYQLSSQFLYEFSIEHKDVFERYKETVEDSGYPSNFNLELREPDPRPNFDLQAAATSLRAIPPGPDHANEYHHHIRGIATALFYPQLVNLTVEEKIYQGRKRIDILADNPMREGFFGRLRTRFDIHCGLVPMECKNYGKEIGNPEFDQLLGRFDELRGNFGILFCRQIADRPVALERCRDAVHGRRGFIILVDDDDIDQMCAAHAAGELDEDLDRRIREILS